MNLGSIVGVIAATKAMNGKFKPKFGKAATFGIVFFILLLILGVVAFVAGIILKDAEPLVIGVLLVINILYLFSISPYFQKADNYRIEFSSDESLANLKIFYKGKEVTMLYKIDQNGKIAFANNMKKTTCVSFADGTNMSSTTKYRIVNYFTKWLSDNKLISNEVTSTFE